MSNQTQFVQLLTEAQPRLYTYIRSLIPDRHQAHDVLQNTNVALWEKAAEFRADAEFGPWATRFAYFQVMAWRRDTGRERHLFSEALVEKIAVDAQQLTDTLDLAGDTLEQCLEKLSEAERTLLRRRYYNGAAVKQIAADDNKTPNAISRALYRVRRDLLTCMEKALA